MESLVQQLAPDLFHVRLPSGRSHLLNCYLWRGDDGVTVVDTGWPGWAPHIEAALHQIDAGRGDVSRIILTHGHVDHIGSAAEIASWSGAEVLAGPGDANIVRSGEAAPQPRLTEAELALAGPNIAGQVAPSPACRVDREVGDGDHLGSAGEITVLHGPGHTDGSIALHWADLGVLLTGDTLAESQGKVILGPFNLDREAAKASAERMSSLGADIVGFGHGDPVRGEGERRLREFSDPLG
jgi:glyoxylase-like metal-dependent hydrolase (beta-lactamase superfamily II)